MALNGKQAYALAKKYTNDTVIGLGGIKGKNCIIQSAIKTNGITDVIFQWTDDNEEVQTTSIQVADGQDDIAITNVDVNEFNHLICMLSDGTIIDAGEIAVSTKASEMDNDLGLTKVENSTSNGNIKIDGVETTVYTLPTLTKSSVGLENVDNTSDASKPVSTATQTALNTKASTTTLTTHTGNADIHVTAADKTAWNNKYVLPTATSDVLGGVKIGNGITITDGKKIETTCTAKNYRKAIETKGWYRICDLDTLQSDKTAVIMLSRNFTNTESEAYIISFCYSHNKPVFNLINSSVGSSGITKIRVVYNPNSTLMTHMYLEMYYALNRSNTVSSAIFYNPVEAQRFIPVNFTAGEIPSGYSTKEFDLTNSKLLSFSSVPATLTSSGTVGDIAYDTNYLYMCTATNTWKKTAWDADVYSTTETVVGTYMGKPLYRKVVDCGALPNNTTKEILHNIANINIITKTSGTAWMNDGITIPLPTASLTSPVEIDSDKSKIYITTITDKSTSTNSNVTLEYTKTTDA